MVYITIFRAADVTCDLRNGRRAGADAPEEQSQYVNETSCFPVCFLCHHG